MARRHTSAASLYNAQTAMFSRMKGTLVELHDRSVRQSYLDLHRLTSGPLKTATLRRMGHPYARGASAAAGGKGAQRGTARARVAPSPINQQTGRLRRSIYLKAVGKSRYRLGASAPYAKFQFSPHGTRRMVRRGVMGGRLLGGRMGELEKLWRARLKGIRIGLKNASR